MSGVDCSYVAGILRAGLLGLGLFLTGCPEPEPNGPPVEIEVGTGLQFTPIEPGSTLELVRGCQGGQHVFVSLRAWDLPLQRNTVELSLERASDGRVVSDDYEVKLRFDPPMSEGEPSLLEGLLLVVTDPDAALGQEVRLKASIRSEENHEGSDEASATLQWGTPGCQ